MADAEGVRPEKDARAMEMLIRALQKIRRTWQAPPGDRYPPSFNFGWGGDIE